MDPAFWEPLNAIFLNWVPEWINLRKKMTPLHFVCTANPYILLKNDVIGAGKVTFKMYFTTDYKKHALKSNQ